MALDVKPNNLWKMPFSFFTALQRTFGNPAVILLIFSTFVFVKMTILAVLIGNYKKFESFPSFLFI